MPAIQTGCEGFAAYEEAGREMDLWAAREMSDFRFSEAPRKDSTDGNDRPKERA